MRKQNKISDAHLIEDYISGNQKALLILVERWHQTFCKVAYWYTKDAESAKDIAQESWAIIMQKLDTLEDPTKFKSWSISLVKRRAIDWLRAKNMEREKLHSFYQEAQTENSSEENDQKVKQKLALLKGFQQLSTEQQYILRLFYIQGYSLKEIADVLKISAGTVKYRLYNAREKLKSLIKNKEYEK